MTNALSRNPETYTYHLGVYSKLVRGNNPDGPIKLGVEARLNGRSKGFPPHLNDLCRPSTFFRDQPMVTEIDPRKTPGGVFVYRPLYLNSRHLGMFARIEARSEEGAARVGRRFTHCAVLFVEEKWEPALLPWAAEMLFTKRHGGRCWGDPVTEGDEQRAELVLPALTRDTFDGVATEQADNVLPLSRNADGSFHVRGRMPDLTRTPDPFVAMATDTAEFAESFGYFIHGRWLSVALGIGPAVEGHGKGYFFRFDLRPEDAPIPRPVTLAFDDGNPPLIAGDFVTDPPSSTGALVDWGALGPAPARGYRAHHNFRQDNLWSDQICSSLRPDPVPARRQAVPTQTAFSQPAGAFREDDLDMRIRDLVAPPMTGNMPEAIPVRFPVPRYLDTRDSMDPDRPTLDDVFAAPVLDGIRPAFRNLTGRIMLLDPAGGFNNFHTSPDDDRVIAAFEAMAMAMIARCALADPDDMRPWVIQQITQPAMPVIGFQSPTDRSGLLQVMLSSIIAKVEIDFILGWCQRQQRLENNLKIQKARIGQIDQGYMVYAPNAQRIKTFFAWLDALQYSAVTDGAYDNASAESCMVIIRAWIEHVAASLRSRLVPPT